MKLGVKEALSKLLFLVNNLELLVDVVLEDFVVGVVRNERMAYTCRGR